MRNPESCRRRFDRNRKDLFHDLLFAHATGIPKSSLPVLEAATTTYGLGSWHNLWCVRRATRRIPNSTFHRAFRARAICRAATPWSRSAYGTALKFVASKFFQASTAMHELGHTMDLRHGGAPPTYTTIGATTTVKFEPNCKPNYLSVMNYLYQFPGLKRDDDFGRRSASGLLPRQACLRWSRRDRFYAQTTFGQTSLRIGPPGSCRRTVRWVCFKEFGRRKSIATVRRFQTRREVEVEGSQMARGLADMTPLMATAPIDWNGEPFLDDLHSSRTSISTEFMSWTLLVGGAGLEGFDDWDHVH